MIEAVRLRESGLQVERTALAWSRTALAVVVNALLVLRAGLQHRADALVALGAALLLAACAVLLFGAWRKRQLSRRGSPCAPPVAALWGLTTLALLTSLAALPVIWLHSAPPP